MKVLHVYRTYFPASQGGLEETIRQICWNTRKHGVHSRVIAPAESPVKTVVRVDGCRVYRPVKSFEIASCTFSREMLALFKRQIEWADVIHYHFPWPFADMLHLWTNPTKPSIVTYHSDIVRQRLLLLLYKPLMQRFLADVDQIICTSPNYFATSDTLARLESKVKVIPFGIDESTYPQPDDSEIKGVVDEFGENFFLFVGVLRYYKGLHILLEAIKGAPFNVVVAGSGPTESALKKQSRELGLENLHFTGYVSNEKKMALFKASRAVVFPSYLRTEAFGVTLLEGAMYGKPLVSTEVGSGTSHVNIDGETGFVVTPGSSKSLRRAMDQLFYNEDLCQFMGSNSRKRFVQFFSGDKMGRRYRSAYDEVSKTTNPISVPQTVTELPVSKTASNKQT